MEAKQRTKGSWGLRFFIILLSIVLGVLLYWLLSFIENDIGMMSGPDWTSVRGRYVTVELDEQQKSLTREIDALKRTIQVQTEQQRFLSADTVSQQNTINQLLSIQKQYIDKGQEFPAESIKILQDTQTAFLKNQEKNQRYNQEITELTRQQRDREDTQATLNETLKSQEEEARVEYNKLCENHRIRVAVLKLAFLVPVFLLVSFVFMKYRASLYWPMVWAAFLAAFFKITIVAHEYFPTRYFKYVAIVVILAIVLRILFYLICMISRPKRDLLLKQYQQDYDKNICPICSKPIRTGLLRIVGDLKKKSIVIAGQETKGAEQGPYTCPSCGTSLYDKCQACGQIRHSLLPYCEHCGQEIQLNTMTQS
jgi:predicted RNA-binding Zn-ribbon protein involved in translation (DUF1610 family)